MLVSNVNANRRIVNEYVNRWYAAEYYQSKEKAIFRLVENFKDSTNFENILLKVIAIDSLYSTRVRKVDKLAEAISRLADINEMLENGNYKIVEKIAGCGVRYEYSFATKYCYFHNPQTFPIYDRYVVEALKYYGSHILYEKLKVGSLRTDYREYVNRLDHFMELFYLEQDYGKLDKYLWLVGRAIIKGEGKFFQLSR